MQKSECIGFSLDSQLGMCYLFNSTIRAIFKPYSGFTSVLINQPVSTIGDWIYTRHSIVIPKNTTRCQFHQRSTSSFCSSRFQNCKKTDNLTVFFVLLGTVCLKPSHRWNGPHVTVTFKTLKMCKCSVIFTVSNNALKVDWHEFIKSVSKFVNRLSLREIAEKSLSNAGI